MNNKERELIGEFLSCVNQQCDINVVELLTSINDDKLTYIYDLHNDFDNAYDEMSSRILEKSIDIWYDEYPMSSRRNAVLTKTFNNADYWSMAIDSLRKHTTDEDELDLLDLMDNI